MDISREGALIAARHKHGQRVVATILFTGVAAAPLPYIPVATLGWLAILPVLISAIRINRAARRLICLLLIAATTQVVVDIVVGTSFEELAKGAARYLGFTASLLGAVWAIERQVMRHHEIALLHGAGCAVGVAIFYTTDSPDHGIWKYGLLGPLTLIAVAGVSGFWINSKNTAWLLVLMPVALVALVSDTRSTAAQVVLTCVLSMVVLRWTPHQAGLRIALLVTAFVLVFSAAANAGLLGGYVQEKWQRQGGTPIRVLTVGRPELSFSLAALIAEKVTPHGSGSKVTREAYYSGRSAMTGLRAPERNAVVARITSNGLDLHSVIATALWQGGLVCGLALSAVAVLAVRRLLALTATDIGRAGPLYVFSGIVLIWDFCFSPWTYFSGPTWGVLLAFLITPTSGNDCRKV